MARFRLSRLAQADLARILATSAERCGIEGRRHYAAMLAAAMRKVAADPEGPTTRTRADLAPGLHSFHLQYTRANAGKAKVRRLVHILYYRAIAPELIAIVRVVHEHMDPSRHLRESSQEKE
jgi:toxin ParE1/3/4